MNVNGDKGTMKCEPYVKNDIMNRREYQANCVVIVAIHSTIFALFIIRL